MTNKEDTSQFMDIYNGDNLMVWKDQEFIYMNLLNVTITMTKEDWEQTKLDMTKMLEL